jgi:hypothetical protein
MRLTDYPPSLEVEPQGKLHDSRIIHHRADSAECHLRTRQCSPRVGKIHIVEQVVRLGSERQRLLILKLEARPSEESTLKNCCPRNVLRADVP